MFESGRRGFWKETPGKAENKRINLKLVQASNTRYNEFSYANIIQDKNQRSYDSLPSVIEENSDYGYAEESYVDNSEAFSDTFPSGFRTEFGGFYINTGKLKLVPLSPKTIKEKKQEKKKFPNLRNMVKKPKRDYKQKTLLKELKKMKFPLIFDNQKKLTLKTSGEKSVFDNVLDSSRMVLKATSNVETPKKF